MTRIGSAVLAAALAVLPATIPTSGAAFRSTGAATSAAFTARSSFGLLQTAPCFSKSGAGGCGTAIGIGQSEHVVVSPDGAHLYTASLSGAAVAAFARDGGTGALTQLPGPNSCVSNAATAGCTTVIGLGGGVYDLAVSPDGKNVYATGYTSDALAAFSRNPTTGVLSQLASPNRCVSSTPPAGCTQATGLNGADGVAISPDGAYVYVASYDASTLTVFARNATTGALTQLAGAAGCITDTSAAVAGCATAKGLGNPYFLHVSPDGGGLYVAAYGSDAVAVFDRDPTTGTVTQPAAPGACVHDSGSAAISGCTAVAGLSGAYHVQVSPDGRSVYATGYDGDSVTAFSRNTTTSALSVNGCFHLSGGTAIAGCTPARGIAMPTGVAVSPNGRSVFVTGYGSNAVAMFRRNSTTGALTQSAGTDGCFATTLTGCTIGSGVGQGLGLTISPDGRDVYVVGGNNSGQGAGWVVPLNLTH